MSLSKLEDVESFNSGRFSAHGMISMVDRNKTDRLKELVMTSIEEPDLRIPVHTVRRKAVYSIMLPDLSRLPRPFADIIRKELIDEDTLSDLEVRRVLNWCRVVKPLYPLKTAGDGNCLLHAVSLAMWGFHDNSTLLRRLIYISLVEDSSKQFQRRWKRELGSHNAEVPEGGLSFTNQQWKREWEIVIRNATDIPEKVGFPYEFLEDIHVFVLANVLCRPIIVLGDDMIHDRASLDLHINNLPGIYLPLLWNPASCCKSPIVLAYNLNHFTPLVGMGHILQTGTSGPLSCVPLVSQDLKQLPLHFPLSAEEQNIGELLDRYLDITEVSYTTADSVMPVLAARIRPFTIEDQFNLIKDFYRAKEKEYMQITAQTPSAGITVGKASVSNNLSPQTPRELSAIGFHDNQPAETAAKIPATSTNISSISNQHTCCHSNQRCNPREEYNRQLEINPMLSSNVDPKSELDVSSRVHHQGNSLVEITQPGAAEPEKCIICDEFCSAPEFHGKCSRCFQAYIDHQTLSSQTDVNLPLAPSAPNQQQNVFSSHEIRFPESNAARGYRQNQQDEQCIIEGCYNHILKATHPYCIMHCNNNTYTPGGATLDESRHQAGHVLGSNLIGLESNSSQWGGREDARQIPEESQTKAPSTEELLTRSSYAESRLGASASMVIAETPRQKERPLYHTEPLVRPGDCSIPTIYNPPVTQLQFSRASDRTIDQITEKVKDTCVGDVRQRIYYSPGEVQTSAHEEVLPCKIPNCSGIRMLNTGGRCFYCSLDEDPLTPQGNEPVYENVRQQTSSGSRSPMSANAGLSNQTNILTTSRPSMPPGGAVVDPIVCVGPRCEKLAPPGCNGLCQDCYRLLESRASGVSEPIHEPAFVVTSSPNLERRPPNVLKTSLCKSPDCDRYGDPNLLGYCSACIKIVTNSQSIPSPLYSTTTQPTCKHSANVPYDQGQNIERKRSGAVKLCRYPACRNYGNSRTGGYCNACFTKIYQH